MKKILHFILVFTFIIPQFYTAQATTYDWDSSYVYITYDGRCMPFSPADKYVSEQNPPSFTWPYVKNAASYDLIVCTDENLSDVKYRRNGLENNYYNFEFAFETGITYYWAVRYYIGSSVSSWSDARRFRIDPDAHVFTAEDIDTIMNKIPVSHPRVWTTSEKLDEFRSYKYTNDMAKRVYDNIVANAKRYVQSGVIPEEPTEFGSPALSQATKMTGMINTTAFAYLLTGDEEIGDFGVQLVEAVSKWSWDDTTGPTSYKQHDQAHRDIAYKSAIAYDWLYDLFQQEKYAEAKESVLYMITERTKKMAVLLDSLRMSPYDSHGWTALGFIGIIGVATHGEIAEADGWLRNVIPLYTAVLPPWSTQDGGWSQGTDYWQYSTNHGAEFMDILALADIVNLYDTAWMQNQYLWTLYAYPAGSYGSFGDQSNRVKAEAETYTAQSMGRIACFTDNPVAKWLSEQTGGFPAVPLGYYASQNEKIDSTAPVEYPLGHEFRDIGWVVMTNDLVDTDRIQMSFKSSPFGSYNHSHADQNSFIIQAYGENLAIKSGYYDAYHTTHDNNITRKTFAHNSITINDGDGQAYYTTTGGSNDRFDASGMICQFVNQMSFDSVTGDATAAYMDSPAGNTTKLDKFVRNMIYVRPDVFIVIDDLDAKGDETASFKWWLNSEHQMEYSDNSALISEGAARLKADVLYPQNTTAAYYDGFYDLSGNYWPANGGAGSYIGKNEQDRVSFATAACDKTKMVVSMSVYKENEQSKVPETVYSADGSYMKLSFEDGTTVLVNLLDNNQSVTAGGITFKGVAVTYSEDSILLTNGNYLEKDGKVLINTSNNATIAIGCNQLCISCEDDTDIFVNKSNQYLSVQSGNSFIDINGRQVSPAIGLSVFDNADGINIAAEKGNYSLLTAKDAPINAAEMIPRDLSIYKNNENKISVSWRERTGCSYDIKINDEIITDVSIPHTIDWDNSVKQYSVSVRAKLGGIISDWSQNVNYSASEEKKYSYVKFTKGERDGTPFVKSEIYANKFDNGNAKFFTGLFGDNGMLLNTQSVDAKTGINSVELIDERVENGEVKTFLWSGERITPLTTAATYKSDNTDLSGIYIDGELLSGFDNSKNEYTVVLTEGDDRLFPIISAKACDNASKVVVNTNFDMMYSTIRVISAQGTERIVTVLFELQYQNAHKVKNASLESSFKMDEGTTVDLNGNKGKISESAIGTFSYKENDVQKTISLNLYSATRINQGGYCFGSRFCSDRSTVSGNYMEVSELSKDLIGWDYFILPNDKYYIKMDDCTDETLEFELTEDAEVVVIGTDTADSLLNDGFSFYSGNFGNARYLNTIGYEDIYYNLAYNGRSAEDVDVNRRFRNYDIAEDWIDVSPLKKVDAETGLEREWTEEEYEAERPARNQFAVLGSGARSIHNFKLGCKYSRVYKLSKDGSRVSLDLSGLKGRIIVIVKPVGPKPVISNVKYIGPRSFDELSSDMTDGCTDTGSKTDITFPARGLLKNNFTDGAAAFFENFSVDLMDDLLETEGSYYIPLSYYLLNSDSRYAWQRAYYFGLGEDSGFEYPGFKNKVNPWYSFDLNASAYLYVVTAGKKPMFIDNSWERIELNNSLFSTTGILKNYGTVYKKYINVNRGETEHVVMQTPGTGDTNSAYYLLIQFVN